MKHLPKIIFSVISHHKQRYATSGDYYEKGGDTHIRVSKMNAKHEFLILVHELIEWFLIRLAGVSIAQIDKFDMEFERKRGPGDTSEPGDDPNAPYYAQHQFATKIEKLLAEHLSVNWIEYDKHVSQL